MAIFCVMTSEAAPGVTITVFSRPVHGSQRQHDLADVAGDHRVDVILVDGALEGAHRFRGRRMIVVGDDLDLAAVDAARGIDLVGGKLRGLRDRRAGDRSRLGDDADLDRFARLRVARRCQGQRAEAGTCSENDGRKRGAPVGFSHCHYLPEFCGRHTQDDGLAPVYLIGLGRQDGPERQLWTFA